MHELRPADESRDRTGRIGLPSSKDVLSTIHEKATLFMSSRPLAGTNRVGIYGIMSLLSQ